MWFSELPSSNHKALLMKSLKQNTSRITASGQESRNDLKVISLSLWKENDPVSPLLFFTSRTTQLTKFKLWYMTALVLLIFLLSIVNNWKRKLVPCYWMCKQRTFVKVTNEFSPDWSWLLNLIDALKVNTSPASYV